MLTADTSVWARALLNDDHAQTRKARSALAQARSRDGVSSPSSFSQNSRGSCGADGKRREFSMPWTGCSEREAFPSNLPDWPGRRSKQLGMVQQVLRII